MQEVFADIEPKNKSTIKQNGFKLAH